MRLHKHTLGLLGLLLFLVTCKTPNQVEEPQPNDNTYSIEENLPVTTTLPGNIKESSGIILINGKVWTHNDSGGNPELFEINTSEPELLRTVAISNAGAYDWEEITQDETDVYIGDFGNNVGNRQDLVIYKVAKADLLNNESAVAETITFSYPDQTVFDAGAYQHNFDCEAMISVGDKLFLFSKNHKNRACRFYSLPKTAGDYEAKLLGEMDTDGVITGADLDTDNNVLALVGYNVFKEFGKWGFKPFVWLLYDYPELDFFAGKSKRVDFPSLQLQMEGICYNTNGKFYISSEAESGGDAFLFDFDAQKWVK